MKDYYNLFVELSLQQCTINNYKDKLKIKKHNEASLKLKQLQDEMKKKDSEDILRLLLKHKDNRVKINAASLCLQMNILVEQTILTLQEIMNDSDDKTICFSAKILLQGIKN